MGLVINIDNISVLEQFGHEYEGRVPCCIRLNPHIAAGGNSHIQTGHIDSKFGISIHQLRHVLRIVTSCKMKVNGLHIHTGSEILDSSVFLRVAELMFEEAKQFPDLEFIDFGSGFKVAYKEGDYTTDIEELASEFTLLFNNFCTDYGKNLNCGLNRENFSSVKPAFCLLKSTLLNKRCQLFSPALTPDKII